MTMRRFTLAWLAVFALSLSVGAGSAEATETISGGTYATMITITQNTRLSGNVTCTMVDSPCIDFGASHIKLWLNGFTMTGPADPDVSNPGSATGCQATNMPPPADGIRIQNQTHAQILGPGMVQKFRRHGLFIFGTTAGVVTKIKVSRVTSHHNCFSGILTFGMSDSVIEGNVSVRNAVNSGGTTPAANPPCGGNCLVDSHNNRIRKNTFAGNGSIGVGNNDFGVGLLFGSSGNRVEDNTIGGNTNGVLIHGNASGNTIRGNIIAGNPPSQVSRTFGASIGADIKDESTGAGTGTRNTIEKNWCITYIGPGPAPCPNFPGHGGDD
jgi:parallel beta-helix repeat protein